ncbi:ABC transporter permease [Azospirillum halopraeferens]|uniref:ABC transporter permease n=1 Tax=Azospirillum halopraeferens TaxID=34010 RepID=UPI0006865ECC|nr:ABC transporter permease [Azospirillum halopraeferens]
MTTRRRGRYPTGIVAAVAVFVLVLPAIQGLMPWDPTHTNLLAAMQPPSAAHWLGTDALGRDMLARLLAACRTSLTVSLAAVALATAGGVLVGIAAGVAGGIADAVLSWAADVVAAVPRLLLAMVAAAVLGGGAVGVTGALALASFPTIVRLARAAVLATLAEGYVHASVASGASGWHVARVHVLPAIRGLMLNRAAALVGTAILVEASLGFLGLGAPDPTLGGLIRDGLAALERAPILAVAPMVTVFAIALVCHLAADRAAEMDGRRPVSPSGA